MCEERLTREQAVEQVESFAQPREAGPLGGLADLFNPQPIVVAPLTDLRTCIKDLEDAITCECDSPVCGARGAHKPMMDATVAKALDGLKAMEAELFEKTVDYVYQFLNCTCEECTNFHKMSAAPFN